MNRKTLSLAVCALAMSGCSIIWAPRYPADTNTDAFTFDAGVDAYEPPDTAVDASVPPDAWTPPEVCDDSARDDEDSDGSRNCNDSDCFGAANCCMASDGAALPVTDIENWSAGGTLAIMGSDATRLLNFGTFGHAHRNFCVPLAAGADISVEVQPRMATGTLGIVLSPVSAPQPGGFLDELAVRIVDNQLFITRAGTRAVLRPPTGMCSGSTDHYNLKTTDALRVIFSVRPGVTAGQPAVIVTVQVAGLCGTTQTLISDAAIPLGDLVSTTDGEGASCDANRGLYLALEGTGSRFNLTNSALPITVYECASPGNFSPQPTVLDNRSVASNMPRTFSAGGIGAPDLVRTSPTDWLLAYDGSVEPRSSELFGNLTTAVGIGRASTQRVSMWNWTADPALSNLADAREPSLRFLDTDTYALVFARRVSGRYELWRSVGPLNRLPMGSPLLTEAGCSYREPVYVEHDANDAWIFFRCDSGSRATVGRATQLRVSGMVTRNTTDLFGPTLGRVRSLDVIRNGDYLAIWVLAEDDRGVQSLHFYSGESPDFPETLAPYPGNPVIRSSELQEDCDDGRCTIQSFAVERYQESTKTYLRFVFARERPTAGSTAYELIARTQFAPEGLRLP